MVIIDVNACRRKKQTQLIVSLFRRHNKLEKSLQKHGELIIYLALFCCLYEDFEKLIWVFCNQFINMINNKPKIKVCWSFHLSSKVRKAQSQKIGWNLMHKWLSETIPLYIRFFSITQEFQKLTRLENFPFKFSLLEHT